MSAPLERAVEKLKAGTHVLLPVKPGAEYMQAIEGYYASRIKYRDRPNCDALKADCWQALMALHAVIEVAKNEAPQDSATEAAPRFAVRCQSYEAFYNSSACKFPDCRCVAISPNCPLKRAHQ